ncbi:hypothetical protein [Moritella viscosa]|uniref:hypothetical protein n=1 Tax=Moritella viscosa TaxID=80854 RepID=UPI00091869BD|nr:hypothetical protein [Moritella viscosa]SGY90308.1 Putative response regulator [Moritella viscosa]
MNTRTTKIFINDHNTEIDKTTFLAGTISGYMTITLQDEDDVTAISTQQYFINTTQPTLDILSYWRAGYIGRYESYKAYYKAEFENVQIKRGNIVKSINGGKGKKVVACWIAAYDKDILAFEVHYPSGGIFRATDIHMGVNHLEQRATDSIPCNKITDDLAQYPLVAMSTPKEKVTHRRKGMKLSIEDEAAILDLLKNSNIKQKAIAERFGVKPSYITNKKTKWKNEGKL